MQRHRELLAAVVAAVAVFVGIVAPALMLVLAVLLAGTGLAMLVMGAETSPPAPDRRRVQNPR